MRKARRALQTAKVDLEAGDGAASVNRSYYAMYYGPVDSLSLWERVGVRGSLIGEFSRRFVEPGPLHKQLGQDDPRENRTLANALRIADRCQQADVGKLGTRPSSSDGTGEGIATDRGSRSQVCIAHVTWITCPPVGRKNPIHR